MFFKNSWQAAKKPCYGEKRKKMKRYGGGSESEVIVVLMLAKLTLTL